MWLSALGHLLRMVVFEEVEAHGTPGLVRLND
jgi:hypothetical protein